MLYYTKTVDETLKELDVAEDGLSEIEAENRLQTYGPNLIKLRGEPLWRKLIHPFTNVFMAVLLVAVIVSIFDHSYVDASIIAAIMLANAVIYYVQSLSTARILRSLQEYRKQTVETVRSYKTVNLDTSQLVPGDIILLGEGEKVPADARITKATALHVDEAHLTGESTSVSKQTRPLSAGKELYDQTNMLFQGSFIASGEATAVVVATGNATEFGTLAKLTGSTAPTSPVQVKIDKLMSQVVVAVSVMAVIAFGLSILRGVSPAESLRFIIALSVSAVPESLPVAISIILVLAMRRMATKKALVRAMSAIETIGSITTIATDKTGTLTTNILTVQDSWHPMWGSAPLATALRLAINHRKEKVHDPLDAALSHFVVDSSPHSQKREPLAAFPFDPETSMSGNVWHHGREYILAIKGAPEAVLRRCDLTEDEREEADARLHKMTEEGYRVIAVAQALLQKAPKSLHSLDKTTLGFAGFVAVADTIRPEAKAAIRSALAAGVSVRMITGDHFDTAYHIGRKLGMVTSRDQVFDSRLMHLMNDDELAEVVKKTRIFSRVIPEHKYKILSILNKRHITAMTGDGVNDVPALVNADVGIAMGSGASIAKDAGDIILLDDNFKSIISAMHEGRTVAGNIRRMLYYLLSTNAGEALTAIVALIVGLPVPLVPVQILWVNLVTDTCMVIPLGLEPGKAANMYEKPRKLKAPILSRFMTSRLILVAVTMATIALGLYTLYNTKYGEHYARTVAFNALVVMQWASALTARSDYQSVFSRLKVFNGKFYAGLAVAVLLQVLALFGPLDSLLHVSSIAVGDMVISAAIAMAAPIIVTEVHKYIGRRWYGKGSPKPVANPQPDMVY